MKKTKLVGSLTMVLMVLMVCGTVLCLANPNATYAFVTSGAECGLRVEAGGEDVDVNRLNPGDTKESYLTVHNDGENPLTYYMDIIRKGGKPGAFWNEDRSDTTPTGAMIEDVLEFTILRGDEELSNGLLKDFKRLKIEGLPAGAHENIDVRVHFPENAGNDYQDSKVTVQFAFHAICKPDEGEGGTPSGPSGPGTGDRPDTPEVLELDPPDEPGVPGEPLEPGAPGEPDEELIVPQGETPAGPGLPKVGQLPPWLWYGAGAILILTGLVLSRRQRSSGR